MANLMTKSNINSNTIAMIGTGYVGLVSGVCFAELGFKTTCVDKDKAKIEALNALQIPIFEPSLALMVEKHLQSGRLNFSSNLEEALRNNANIFIAVGTPTDPKTGKADLQYIEAVAIALAPLLTEHRTIIVKSTVPVGTNHAIANLIKKTNPHAKFSMASNPEFLREGSAVYDFLNPDRIIVGSESETVVETLNRLYQPLIDRGIPIVHSDICTAEMIKYTSNCFLATKIAFVNEIAGLSETLGANIQAVMKGVGLDNRIGSGYLNAGPGYGGSCFPKDTLALANAAREVNSPLQIVEAVIRANEAQKQRMIQKILKICGGRLEGKSLGVLGVAFKANTDDIRDSAALTIIQGLLDANAHVTAFDPAAMQNAKAIFPDVTWAKSIDEAMAHQDAVVILTEWECFKDLDLIKMTQQLRKTLMPATLIDLRNLYDPQIVAKAGLQYVSLGRPTVSSLRLRDYVL